MGDISTSGTMDSVLIFIFAFYIILGVLFNLVGFNTSGVYSPDIEDKDLTASEKYDNLIEYHRERSGYNNTLKDETDIGIIKTFYAMGTMNIPITNNEEIDKPLNLIIFGPFDLILTFFLFRIIREAIPFL